MDIKIVRQYPEYSAYMRRQFDHHKIGRKFLMYLYQNNYLQPYEKLLDMESIKQGIVPSDFEIHHICPLFAGGKNDFDNLVLIDKKLHAFIHLNYFDKVIEKLKYGEERIITQPDLKKVCIFEEYQPKIIRFIRRKRERLIRLKQKKQLLAYRKKLDQKEVKTFFEKLAGGVKKVDFHSAKPKVQNAVAAKIKIVHPDISYMQQMRNIPDNPTAYEIYIMNLAGIDWKNKKRPEIIR